MSSVRITVTLSGATGLDDADDLLVELEGQTGLGWQVTERLDDKHLTGLEPLVLFIAYKLVDKIIDKVADKDADLLVDKADQAVDRLKAQVDKAIDRFKGRRMDPPEITAEVSEPDDPRPGAGEESADDQGPAV